MSFTNAISWFEIPATDLERAQRFYETIFDVSLIPMDMDNFQMRMFPIEDPQTGIGGALIKAHDFYKPSATEGVLIYLNANPDVDLILNKVEAAGGKIVMPKTEISSDYGFMGVFTDSEGNRIGLHSNPVQRVQV
jgi:predicted enzyme related to lactoylglutathione lyase